MELTPPPAKRAPSAPAAADADRLSALDDAVLHAILGRLPLRDAAGTTALSRRWPRVFATLPRLLLHPATFNRRGFDDGGDEDYCEDPWRWMDALAAVLIGRAAPVAAFEIHARFMGLYEDWFLGVFRALCGSGGLLELSVTNTKYAECYPLPAPVYSCETLTTLDLYNWRLRVPGRITGLRAVRTLRLRRVVAGDDDLRRIITRCSAMEHLEIWNVHRARNVVIRAPCLEKLEVYSHRPLCVSVKKAPRLDTVWLGLSYGWPEFHWSINDTMDSDEEYSYSEIQEMCDYEMMAEREHKKADEVGNMLTFLGGLGAARKLRLSLPREYAKGPFGTQEFHRNFAGISQETVQFPQEWGNIPAFQTGPQLFGMIHVLSMGKVSSMPKRLPKKSYLLGLETLTLSLELDHEVLSTLVSCLLNSSPNLKNLRIFGGSHQELRHAEFWEKQINAECLLNHLSCVTFYISGSVFEGQPSLGLCQYLVMNARGLKRMSIHYFRREVKPEHEAMVEDAQKQLHVWPRASPNVVLELSPIDRYPCF
ncbi:hypothetical protein ACP70R_029425 [Stipagrostis hirtigluma subsp. patula]